MKIKDKDVQNAIKEIEKDKQLQEYYKRLHPDQPMPCTRRDFINTGLIGGAMAMGGGALDLLTMASAHAQGASCPALIPIPGNCLLFQFNLAGGAHLNRFIPTSQQNGLLPDGTPWAIPGDLNAPANKLSMNGVDFVKASLNGMIESITKTGLPSSLTGPELAGIKFANIVGDAADDSTSSNGHIINTNFQAPGQLYTSDVAFESGGPFSTYDNNRHFPLSSRVTSSSDLINGFNLGGYLDVASSTPSASKSALIDGVMGIMAKKVGAMPTSTSFKDYVLNRMECTRADLQNVLSAPVAPDARTLATYQSIFEITNLTSPSNFQSILAQTVSQMHLGHFSKMTFQYGNFDYHDKTFTTGNNMDKVIGNYFRMLFKMAATLQKQIMIVVTTDGGCRATGALLGSTSISTDHGTSTNAIIMAADYTASGQPISYLGTSPNKPRPYTLGWVAGGNNDAVLTSHPFATNPKKVAGLLALNMARLMNPGVYSALMTHLVAAKVFNSAAEVTDNHLFFTQRNIT